MRLARVAPLAAIAVLVAACSSGGSAASFGAVSAAPTSSEAPSTAAGSGAPSADPSAAAATRIEITLADSLTITPAAITAPSGVPVTFVVKNTGTVLHEFVLGDEGEQTAHEQEMASSGGMAMPEDEPMAIGVQPGATKELTVTFDKAGTIFAGCHVTGHYAAGMKATITIN